MRPLVTCLQEKLLKIEFRLKKIDEKIVIYNKTCEKADEWFQSIYAEAASLVLRTNNHVFMDSLLIGINWFPSEAVKQYWQKSVYLLLLEVVFADMKLRFSQEKRPLRGHPQSSHWVWWSKDKRNQPIPTKCSIIVLSQVHK